MVMPNAKKIRFFAGSYITNAPDEIAHLDAQIAAGHQMIYTKKGQETVTSESLDPLAAIKKKVIDEYLAAQAAQADTSRDMGNTSADPQAGMQTSKSIGAITVGSNVSAKK
jgi:hypothetical protein